MDLPHTDRQTAEDFFVFGSFLFEEELKNLPFHNYEYLLTRENFINKILRQKRL